MRITHLEILKVPPSWVWLRVHTDAGIVGLGEPFLEGHGDSVIAEVRRLEALLIGQDPTRRQALWERMYAGGSGYRGGPVTLSAISGIDMALWDITGKAAGVPIYQLLGGACRDRIPLYRAVGPAPPHCVTPGLPYRAGRPAGPAPDRDDPANWAASTRTIVHEWGFRALKVHLSPGEGLAAATQIARYVAIVAAVQGAAGPGVDVAVDIHNPNPSVARQLIAALTPLHPLFIEEPMPIERVDTLEQIVRGTDAPIAAGERWMGKWIFFDALSRGLLAVVQPDLAHAGGFTECQKIAAIAEAAYAQVAPHCPLSPLALAATIQLDAALPNFLVQEHNEVNDWREGGRTLIGKGYLAEPFALGADGCVAVPDGPGLGIAIDEDGLRAIMARPWSVERG